MIAILIEFDIKPGRREAFEAQLRRDVNETLTDDGCLRMEILFPRTGGDRIVLSELWRDQGALDAHRTKPGHSHAWQEPLISAKRVEVFETDRSAA